MEHRPLRGNRIRSRVFFRYVPVASFYEEDLASQKIAAIQLVEADLASIQEVAEVVGLHRNTVSEAIKTKQLLGIESAIKDDRGRKQPIHYTPAIKVQQGYLKIIRIGVMNKLPRRQQKILKSEFLGKA